MNLASLRQRTREFLDDYEGIKRFSDARIDAALNESQVEACKRSDLIVAKTVIQMTDGENVYALPATIKKVKRVRYKTRVLVPSLTSQKDIDDNNRSDWESKSGTPTQYIIDAQSSEIKIDRFIETTTTDDDLTIEAVSLPLNVMVDDTDVPEIAGQLHVSLCYWAVSLLLMDSDPDTQDPNKADRFARLYADIFGEPVNAQAFYQRANNTKIRARARFL
jgi:hypothetical protein